MGPSAVWIYFSKINHDTKVKCKECNKELAFNKSTTTLANHLLMVHKIEIKKHAVKRCQSDAQLEAENFDVDQQVNIFFVTTINTSNTFSFSHSF